MSKRLTGDKADLTLELIQKLAEAQLKMEAGHFDTARTIMRYVDEKFPNEPPMKYPTIASRLRNVRTEIQLGKLKKK